MASNQRLSSTITIGSVLEQSVKKNVGFLKTGLHQIGDEIKGVERRQRELGKQRQVLIKQGRSVEDLDREYEDLNRTMARLRRTQERWNRTAAASRRVGASFSSMMTNIGRSSRTVAVGVGLAGGAVFGLASSTAQLGDDVAKTADKLGIQIGALQELRYAAERSGVSTGAFDQSLEKMLKNLGEASTGTGAAKDALDDLGLSAEDLIALSPAEALEVIADRMQGVGTQAEKAAIANDIFGRSGIGMLNMLRDGSDGLRTLREDARRTGYVLSEEAARDAEVFQDVLLDTQLTMKGLKNTVGAELMPVVTDAKKRVGDALVGNREQVKAWASSFADGVERALPVVGEIAIGIGKVASMTGRVIKTTADMVGGWENFGIVIGAVLASRTVISVIKFGGAVFSLGRAMLSLAGATPLVVGGIRAIGTALLLNPIGLAIAAIAGGAYLIYKNWDAVGPWFKDLWGNVKGYFGGLSNFVGGVFSGDMDRALGGLKDAWGGFSAFWSGIFNGVGKVMTWVYESAIKPVTDALGITEPIEQAWASAKKTVGALFEAVGSVFGNTYDNLIAPAIDGMSSVGSIGDAWDAVKTSMQPILDWIGQKFEWVGGLISPVIDALKWGLEYGAAAANALGFGGADSGDASEAPQPRQYVRNGSPQLVPPVQKRALGGSFLPGLVLSGENGPELKFENRSGYVANNRAMRQLADYAAKAGELTPSGRSGGLSGRMAAALGGSGVSAQVAQSREAVTQNVTNHFHASGVSAEELLNLAERKQRQQSQGGLYDRGTQLGAFGG